MASFGPIPDAAFLKVSLLRRSDMKRVACVAGFALLLVAQLTAQTNSALVNYFDTRMMRIEFARGLSIVGMVAASLSVSLVYGVRASDDLYSAVNTFNRRRIEDFSDE